MKCDYLTLAPNKPNQTYCLYFVLHKVVLQSCPSIHPETTFSTVQIRLLKMNATCDVMTAQQTRHVQRMYNVHYWTRERERELPVIVWPKKFHIFLSSPHASVKY